MNEFEFYYGVEFSDDMELYTYSTWAYYVAKADSVGAMATTITEANHIWVGGMASYGGEQNLLLGMVIGGMVGGVLQLFPEILGDMLQSYSAPTYLNGIVSQLAGFGLDKTTAWDQWGYGAYSYYATSHTNFSYSLAALTGTAMLTDFEWYAATGYALADAQSAALGAFKNITVVNTYPPPRAP